MSGISDHYLLRSDVGGVQEVVVMFLAMSGISEHCVVGSVVV